MGARVIATFGHLEDVLPRGEELMRELGELVVRKIRTRTERMQDKNGSPFRPLSKGYAKQKEKALGHSRPDLQVSGRMLNDMGVVAVTETTADISFRSQGGSSTGTTFIQRSRAMGAMDKAFYAVEGNHGIIRDFFDSDEAIEQACEEALGHAADVRIERVIG